MSAELSQNSFIVVPPLSRTVHLAVQRAAQLIQDAERFLVVTHASPDGDAIGSALALAGVLRGLGKRDVVVLDADPVPYNLRFLLGAADVVRELSPAQRAAGFDVVCVLDCNRPEALGSAAGVLSCGSSLLVIDHHDPVWSASPEGVPTPVVVSDTAAAATGELVYRLAVELGVDLSPQLAECLYTTLVTDTGSFRYGSTTPVAHAIAAALLSCGVDPWRVASQVYESQPLERIQILGEALRNLVLSSCGRLAVLRVGHELVARAGGADSSLLDGLINHARSIRGVEVAAQLLEVSPDLFELTLRSRGQVDVGRLAQRLGGRGSHYAGRCTVTGPVGEIIAQLTAQFVLQVDGAAAEPSSDALEVVETDAEVGT